ncbi:MAG: DUF6514 family protein [Defluviitaleaceae bacterium]|nr:DUF6514 family protein [Defluviitaleaceae bacterium]
MEVVLQKNIPVTVVEGHNEDGHACWLLEYYLQTYPNPSHDGKGRFGIKIIRKTLDGYHDHAAETFAISDSVSEVLEMIRVFSKGAVRPGTLNDMAEEWLSEQALGGAVAAGHGALSNWYTYHAG